MIFALLSYHFYLESFLENIKGEYCFEKWNSAQKFWNNNYDLTKIIDKIDLDSPKYSYMIEKKIPCVIKTYKDISFV